MTGIASRSQLRMSFLRYALFTVPAVCCSARSPASCPAPAIGNPWFDALRQARLHAAGLGVRRLPGRSSTS